MVTQMTGKNILRLPRLRTRDGGTYTARIKIPPDLQAVYADRFGQRWAVKESWPKTLSPAEANRAFAERHEHIKARFDALRDAIAGRLQTLEHRQVHELVARRYMDFVGRYENSPGDPQSWDFLLGLFRDALEDAAGIEHWDRGTDFQLSDPVILAIVRDHVAEGTKADAWLANRGYALTPESRAAFLDALAPQYAHALGMLWRRAKGDYSRDPVLDTFPTLEAPSKAGNAISIRALFDQWVSEKKPARGTITRWQLVIDAAALRWPDPRRVTDSEAREWLKERVTDSRSAATVNRTWRTALKTICNWAQHEGRIKDNPFSKVKISVPRRTAIRESKAFTDSEAATILQGALAVEIRTPIDAACRWLPWLCAYSGARPGEIAQLRGQDVQERDSIRLMVLTPEAGTIKNRKIRIVPLHDHLIEQGFLEFVKARGQGPLFYEPHLRSGKNKKVPYIHVIQKVGEWVRSLGITDPEISPNHAWRHRFKLVAERANVPERLSDYITGHAPASTGRAYGQPTLSDLAREIKKLPCYEL